MLLLFVKQVPVYPVIFQASVFLWSVLCRSSLSDTAPSPQALPPHVFLPGKVEIIRLWMAPEETPAALSLIEKP